MDGQNENMTVDLSEAGLGQENQLIITGEDGHGYPVSVSGMITVPMSSMYQMVANIQHLHQNGDGTVCLTPIQVSNTGGSLAPNTKYQLLKAVSPINSVKYDLMGNGISNNNNSVSSGIVGIREGSTSNGAPSSSAQNGQMSTGLASLIDVIQLQLKNEEEMNNDCNNNGRDDQDSRGGAATGGGVQRQKAEFSETLSKRIVVQVKQK